MIKNHHNSIFTHPEIDSMEEEFKSTYLEVEFKAITLMRWIRKGMENGTFTILK